MMSTEVTEDSPKVRRVLIISIQVTLIPSGTFDFLCSPSIGTARSRQSVRCHRGSQTPIHGWSVPPLKKKRDLAPRVVV